MRDQGQLGQLSPRTQAAGVPSRNQQRARQAAALTRHSIMLSRLQLGDGWAGAPGALLALLIPMLLWLRRVANEELPALQPGTQHSEDSAWMQRHA